MHHSAIGDIRAYILTVQCTNDPVKVKVAANGIIKAAEEIKKAAEELEGKKAHANL